MPHVRVVTDSAADIPPELVAEHQITVVPLSIHFGSKTYIDGEDMSPSQFYQVLARDPNFPRTSQPSLGRFEQAYRKLHEEGAEIISIHLSSKLSGTYNAAVLGAKNVEGASVHPFDSLTASMAQGELVLAAARMAAEGKTVAEILAALEGMRRRIDIGLMVDSLTHMQRGGRIGRAQSLVGTLLSVKPLIGIEDGVVVPRGRVRTAARALQDLANEVQQRAPLSGLRIMHANAPKLAQDLEALVRPYAPGEIPVQLIGAVVGTHIGTGAVGMITVQADKG